jgi:hypothetical protein
MSDDVLTPWSCCAKPPGSIRRFSSLRFGRNTGAADIDDRLCLALVAHVGELDAYAIGIPFYDGLD